MISLRAELPDSRAGSHTPAPKALTLITSARKDSR